MSRTVEVWTNDPENKMVVLTVSVAMKKREKKDSVDAKPDGK